MDNKKEFLVNFCFISIISLIILFIGKVILGYLLPFVVAIIIAWFMQRPSAFLSRKTKISKGIIACVLSVGIYIIFAFLIIFFLYRMIGFLSGITKILPDIISFVSKSISKIELIFLENLRGISENNFVEFSSVLRESINNITHKATNVFSSFAGKIVKTTPSFLFSMIAAVVATCYIAKDFDGLKRFLKALCTDKVYKNISTIKIILTDSVFKIIKGYFLLTIVNFIILSFGFLILKVEHFLLLGLIVAFVDLLPVLGTGIILLPWSIFSFFNENNFLGIGLIVLYFAVIVIRNFIEPKIIGTQIGINPLFVLISMFLGLKVMGFLGLIVFPIALIVVIKFYKKEMEAESF